MLDVDSIEEVFLLTDAKITKKNPTYLYSGMEIAPGNLLWLLVLAPSIFFLILGNCLTLAQEIV